MNSYAKCFLIVCGMWMTIPHAIAMPATAEIYIDVGFEIRVLNGPGTIFLAPPSSVIEETTASGVASSDT